MREIRLKREEIIQDEYILKVTEEEAKAFSQMNTRERYEFLSEKDGEIECSNKPQIVDFKEWHEWELSS